MPYIMQKHRSKLDPLISEVTNALALDETNAGDINYIFTKILLAWYRKSPGYGRANAIEGVLACVAKEFYRRVTSHYEDEKIRLNGDVFEVQNPTNS